MARQERLVVLKGLRFAKTMLFVCLKGELSLVEIYGKGIRMKAAPGTLTWYAVLVYY